MILSVLLFAVSGSGIRSECSLIRPVAPDETSARRIAEAVIKNVPASPRALAAEAADNPYDLIVEPDPDEPNKWLAFQSPPDRKSHREGEVIISIAGHGLGFRVDRCTGAISKMHYQR